ncbi:MAG: NAD(P)/FAD-dependent oxidoreductase [Candidatus Omnitrophica bacterium]|nr:NAD(P)/FAD-dependent oxidoreductase [Candidatus Omnitrophota bacterium]
MKIYDLIIIGAGVVGTAIARELSCYKLNIAVLEKEQELAFGVSKSNSGIIHPGTQNHPDSLKGKLCVQGNKLIRKIARQLGVDFKQIGELIVAFKQEDIPQLHELKAQAKKLGVRKIKIVNQTWLRKHEPNISPDAVAALYAPTAGIISPYRLTYDLAENAMANGVEIFTLQKVVTITSESHNDLGKSFLIKTLSTEFRARYIINAAGLSADEIANMVGISDFKIEPRKGEEFILDKKHKNLTKHLLFPLPEKNSKGILVIKTADGNTMIGPTAENCADKQDLSTTEEGLQKVLSSAQRMVPSINQTDIIAYFAGLRPVAGDDFIIRHELSVPSFITVAGIQSPGLTAAPAIAKMVGRILKDNGLALKRKWVFKALRKKTIHLFAIPFSKTAKLIKKDPAYGDIVCRCEMVSAKEIKDAINRGAKTLDGIKFRTRAQAGRCHGGFCTTRIMKILSKQTNTPLSEISKKGPGSWVVMEDRADD